MKTFLKELRWGRFNLIEQDMISQIASLTGEWCEVEVQFLTQLLGSSANVVEVGANIGLHSVPLAKRITQGKLLSFEPQRIIFQQLCCNLALNNLTNVETFRLGVGRQNETKEIESCDYDTLWNYGSFSLDKGFSTEENFTMPTQKEYVDIVALDDFAPVQRL